MYKDSKWAGGTLQWKKCIKKNPPKQSHNIATCSTQHLYIGAGMLLPARPPESPFPVCAQILSCSHLTGQLSSDLQLISRTVASLCSKRHSHRRKIRFLFWKAKKNQESSGDSQEKGKPEEIQGCAGWDTWARTDFGTALRAGWDACCKPGFTKLLMVSKGMLLSCVPSSNTTQ